MAEFPVVGQKVLNFIQGEWVESVSGKSTSRFDPADQSIQVATAPDSTAEDASRAISAAARAAQDWRLMPAPSRGKLLFEWLKWIDAHRDALAMLLTREEGKTLPESAGEVTRAIDILEFTAGMARRIGGKVFPADEKNVFCYSRQEPLGVVGLISPWNFPVAIPVWKMAPALVAGNTVVLKPSPLTPLTATALVQGAQECGFPAGVVNLVHGDVAPGVELVANPLVNGVSFTGSTAVGKAVARSASERLLKLQLELGGKNPQLILEDADLDLAIKAVIAGAFGSTGQRCTATSRAIVVGNIYDAFLDGVVQRSSSMKIGPGVNPGTEIGPLVDGRALAGVGRFCESAKKENGDFIIGGQRLEEGGLDRGFFFAPTVVEARPNTEIAREEVFGPVLSVIRAGDLEQALEIANSVRYGLTSTIFTRDVSKVFKFAENAQAGMIHINRPGVGGYSHVPFGGIKDSGYGGREVGDDVIDFYTETRVVTVNYGA